MEASFPQRRPESPKTSVDNPTRQHKSDLTLYERLNRTSKKDEDPGLDERVRKMRLYLATLLPDKTDFSKTSGVNQQSDKKIEKISKHIQRLENSAAHCGRGKAGRNKRNHLKDLIDQYRHDLKRLS